MQENLKRFLTSAAAGQRARAEGYEHDVVQAEQALQQLKAQAEQHRATANEIDALLAEDKP